MRTLIRVSIFIAIVAIVIGLAWREQLIRVYPPDVRRYQLYVQNILTEEYKSTFLDAFPELKTTFHIATPSYLLMWLGQYLEYISPNEPLNTRYDDPIAIIEQGVGRCHEFALTYLALMYSQGYTPRLVLDMSPPPDGDHVWVEYALGENTWVHVEPTEGAIYTLTNAYVANPYVDNPLMYERDWGKSLTEVWGIEPHFCQRIEEGYQYEV